MASMRKSIYILTTAILMAQLAPSAMADSGVFVFTNQRPVTQSHHIQYAQKKISPRQAKAIARSKVRDAVVIDLYQGDGVYKVRMQKKNGRVIDVYVDALTGRVR